MTLSSLVPMMIPVAKHPAAKVLSASVGGFSSMLQMGGVPGCMSEQLTKHNTHCSVSNIALKQAS
jgi:hypothetical protein